MSVLRARLRLAASFVLALTAYAGLHASAQADTLLQRAQAGQKVRVGFANTPPWAFPGDNNEAMGFVNAIVIGTLKTMGITNIEPVVTDWGGFIPGLQADRFDIITGGLFVLKTRCDNITFSDPIAAVNDVFIVPAGNPKHIQTYDDIKKGGDTLVTVTGYNIVGVASKLGIPDANVMQVPGPTELLPALLAGRADAVATNYFEAKTLVDHGDGKVELTDTSKMPDWTKNWSAIGFRKSDADFVTAYNKAQATYLGSTQMLSDVAKYGYTKAQLPGNVTTDYVCANR